MIRSSLQAGSAGFWAAIAAWFFVDRAAHGSAAAALPVAALLFAAGTAASFVLAKAGVLGPGSTPARRHVGARAARLGNAITAAIAAVIATLLIVPFELTVRAQSDDSWLLVAGRCLVHPLFAFAAALAAGRAARGT